MSGIQIAGVLCMAGGLLIVLKGVLAAALRRAALRDPIRKNATVIRLDRVSTEGDLDDWYVPTVEYRGEDGERYEGQLLPVIDADKPKVGHSVKITYQGGNPRNLIDPNSGWPDAAGLFIGLAGGLLLLVIGAGMVFSQLEIVEANPKAPPGAKE